MINKNSNKDVCEGVFYPKNAQMQGEAFERFKSLMTCMRYRQLIKQITYKIEIEYYPEVENEKTMER